ncbi:MAG: ArnT family glycosyltransferase, partial [Anaerolineae bacterium]
MHTHIMNTARQRISFWVPVLIVLLGVLHALIHALVMPPWGLLDEQQHFHYIQMIAQEQRAPVMWRDRLPEEIVDSIFAVKRYITLGSDRMPSREEFDAAFDAHSYEGHHPPLYYAILALFYPLGPSDVVGKLFLLRIVGALLSSITLLLVWVSTRRLWPDAPFIAVIATLFVALNPERAASAGRVNNDLLVEIASAGVFACLALGWARGTGWRRAVLTGLCLGAAILSKLSAWMILPAAVLGWTWAGLLHRQPYRKIAGQALIVVVIVSVCLGSVAVRNLVLYGEPTGVGAFVARIHPLVSGPLSERIVTGIADLVRNSWVITWDGARVVTKPSAALMELTLALLSAFL